MPLETDLFATLAGLVLVWSGLVKTLHRWEFVAIVRSWRVIPEPFDRWFGTALPLAELATGGAVLTALSLGLFEAQSRLAALVLFGFLLAGQLVVLRKRRAARCGCFGRTESLGFGSIGRGGVCLALAFASLVPLS